MTPRKDGGNQMNLKNKLKKAACTISLLGMLASPLMAQNRLVLGDVPAINPNSLMGVSFGVYSEEFPIPVMVVLFDTNHDGWEDARFIYSMNPYADGMMMTENLIEYGIDWNKNGFYEDSELFSSIEK